MGRCASPGPACSARVCGWVLGRTHDRRYTTMLRDLVMSGRAHPGRIVSHHATLDEAPRYFQEFDRREAGVVKVVFRP